MKHIFLTSYVILLWINLSFCPLISLGQKIDLPNEYAFTHCLDLELEVIGEGKLGEKFTVNTKFHYTVDANIGLWRPIESNEHGEVRKYENELILYDLEKGIALRTINAKGTRAKLVKLSDFEKLKYSISQSKKKEELHGITCQKITYHFQLEEHTSQLKANQIEFWISEDIQEPNYFRWLFNRGTHWIEDVISSFDIPKSFPLKAIIKNSGKLTYVLTFKVIQLPRPEPYSFFLENMEIIADKK